MVTHSVREAALLADRIIVFSSRPARVVGDIAIAAQDRDTPAKRAVLVEQISAALSRGWDDDAGPQRQAAQ